MTDADHAPHDNAEPGPDKEPKSAKAWLETIALAEKAFETYQDKCDNIDKLFADLDKLSNVARDRQFQIFWANVQTLAPSIYSRPPVPVVVPRFKDRKPLPRTASELLERNVVVMFDAEDIDGTLKLIRDDLAILSRGAAWVRYDTEDGERACIEHVDRKDFLHEPARKWKEVDWVAKRSFLTKERMRKRFEKHSGDEYLKAAYEQRKEENGDADDGKLKAAVWEIWCRSQKRVLWVSEGCENLLDDGEPHLTLEGFFPCPRPAYATLQRRSLVPVPDVLMYKDQIEEINDLTARIHALADAVKVRGFYPAGAGEIGDAIEAAMKATSDNQVMIGVSNWAMLGGGAAKDMIVWLPLDMITDTIKNLVELRRQLMQDVYEISGISDILRGQTDPNETLGAQELKAQTGSTRIKDKQQEMVRLARDITRIVAEIMAENFSSKHLVEASQLEVPTNADIAGQVKPLEAQIMQIVQQVERAKSDPQMMQQAQANPEQAQQMMQQAQQQAEGLQGQIDKLKEQPTVESVMQFLRDQRVRPFVLDIETDSTIAPDENAQKQRATEFITAVGGFMNQVLPLAQQVPQAAPLAAESLKFVASQFRAGRMLEQTIEEFADQMKAMAGQPKPPDPEQVKAEAEAKARQEEAAAKAQERQQAAAEKAQEQQRKAQEAEAAQERENVRLSADLEVKRRDDERKVIEHNIKVDNERRADERAAQIHAQQMEKGLLDLEAARVKIEQTQVQTANSIATTDAGIQATHEKTEAGIAAQEAKADAKEPA